MATGKTPNGCSICEKGERICICGGCEAPFCVKHFNEHRQELSVQFDHDVVRTHDELLGEIDAAKQLNYCSADLLSQIDRWEKETIDKVHQAAERTRQELIQFFTSDRETCTEQFQTLSMDIRRRREDDEFAEGEIQRLRQQIDRVQSALRQVTGTDEAKMIIVKNDNIDWNRLIYVRKASPLRGTATDISPNAKWTKNGITLVGENGRGSGSKQLNNPKSLYVDDDATVYIADEMNHRIVEWKCGATSGQVVAGGNGKGNRDDQLNSPTDVIVDKASLIICDYENRRVVRWPRRSGTSGETIISNIDCSRLTMDNQGFLYVSDYKKHVVTRWQVGESGAGTVVAGGNGKDDRLDQLNWPLYVSVDRDHSVYVSDSDNHRVMKWVEDAKEGIVVAGGRGKGNGLTQLNEPRVVVVDQLGTVYVADFNNHRIMRWPKEATQGSILVGGNGQGGQPNQLSRPDGLSFDRHGNLYVVDFNNDRVQIFTIE